MAIFYLPKNPEIRVPPDPQLVQWLTKLDDGYHALFGVIGTDFKSSCIVLKPRGIFNVHVDSSDYRTARKNGNWATATKLVSPNPLPFIEDQTAKILDYVIKVRDKIFSEELITVDTREKYSGSLQVFWLVALTCASATGDHPKTNGRIFHTELSFSSYITTQAWPKTIPKSMSLDQAAARRLANLLGVESVSLKDLVSIRPRSVSFVQNPYYFTGQVSPERFRGRSEEISIAKSCLSQDPSTPVILVGLQRTGKSSLAGEIIRQLTTDEKRLRVISFVFGDWDEKGEDADVAGFLLKNIPDRENIESLINSITRVKKSIGLERDVFKDALKHLRKTTKIKTLVFLDELHKMEEMTNWPGRASFANFLESIAGDKALGLKLLVSARPIMLTGSESIRRTNLLKLFRPIPVASLDPTAAIQIVNFGQADLSFEQVAIDRILKLSGRNPYWIQLLCYEIFIFLSHSGHTKKVTREVVDIVFSRILKSPSSASYFEASYQDIVPLESSMLLLDAAARLALKEDFGITCGQVRDACDFSEEIFNRNLAPLLHYEILVKNLEVDPVTLSFLSEGLRHYLRQERNLSLGQIH